jgi:hypothetical protein
MLPEIDLEQIETDIKEARASEDAGRIGTHWTGCWVSHPLCAIPLVEELVKALREQGRRQVALDRIILEAVFRKGGNPSGWDDDQKVEIKRIMDVWKVNQ